MSILSPNRKPTSRRRDSLFTLAGIKTLFDTTASGRRRHSMADVEVRLTSEQNEAVNQLKELLEQRKKLIEGGDDDSIFFAPSASSSFTTKGTYDDMRRDDHGQYDHTQYDNLDDQSRLDDSNLDNSHYDTSYNSSNGGPGPYTKDPPDSDDFSSSGPLQLSDRSLGNGRAGIGRSAEGEMRSSEGRSPLPQRMSMAVPGQRASVDFRPTENSAVDLRPTPSYRQSYDPTRHGPTRYDPSRYESRQDPAARHDPAARYDPRLMLERQTCDRPALERQMLDRIPSYGNGGAHPRAPPRMPIYEAEPRFAESVPRLTESATVQRSFVPRPELSGHGRRASCAVLPTLEIGGMRDLERMRADFGRDYVKRPLTRNIPNNDSPGLSTASTAYSTPKDRFRVRSMKFEAQTQTRPNAPEERGIQTEESSLQLCERGCQTDDLT